MSPAGAKHLSFRRRRCSDADRPVEASSSELSLLSSTSSSSAIALSRFVGIGLISGSRIIAIDAPPREAHCRGRCLPPLNGATSPTDTPGWSTTTGSVSSAATNHWPPTPTGRRGARKGGTQGALLVDGDSAVGVGTVVLRVTLRRPPPLASLTTSPLHGCHIRERIIVVCAQDVVWRAIRVQRASVWRVAVVCVA
jgi:hypothetical protein